MFFQNQGCWNLSISSSNLFKHGCFFFSMSSFLYRIKEIAWWRVYGRVREGECVCVCVCAWASKCRDYYIGQGQGLRTRRTQDVGQDARRLELESCGRSGNCMYLCASHRDESPNDTYVENEHREENQIENLTKIVYHS